MSRLINADKLKEKYPNRKSLNWVLDNAPSVSLEEMCENYCKMPFKYSENEWEDIRFSDKSPCLNCPFDKLKRSDE